MVPQGVQAYGHPKPAYRDLGRPGERVPQSPRRRGLIPLLYVHRPILDEDFHSKPQSGGFTLGAPGLLWDLSIYIQTHEFFPHTKSLRERHPKTLVALFHSPQATNRLRRSANWRNHPNRRTGDHVGSHADLQVPISPTDQHAISANWL